MRLLKIAGPRLLLSVATRQVPFFGTTPGLSRPGSRKPIALASHMRLLKIAGPRLLRSLRDRFLFSARHPALKGRAKISSTLCVEALHLKLKQTEVPTNSKTFQRRLSIAQEKFTPDPSRRHIYADGASNVGINDRICANQI